jgi:hypothetical protein
VKLVAGTLDGVLDAIADVRRLVTERLVAVGLAPGLLHVGLGVTNGSLQVIHLGSSIEAAGAALEMTVRIHPLSTPRAIQPRSCNPITAAIPPHQQEVPNHGQ